MESNTETIGESGAADRGSFDHASGFVSTMIVSYNVSKLSVDILKVQSNSATKKFYFVVCRSLLGFLQFQKTST